MGDGDHFGAEGDWSEDKERRLRDGITGIAKVVLDAHDAALRARVVELEGEVGRLRGVVVESDKDLVASAARKIARDHNMPLKSAEWMMLEALRVVRSNDNREHDAAIARATAAENERDAERAAHNQAIVELYDRATAAEAREARLMGALCGVLSVAGLCLPADVLARADAALAATKEVLPCR